MAKKVTVLPDKDYNPRNNIQQDISRDISRNQVQEEKHSGIWYWIIGLLLLGLMKAITHSVTSSTKNTSSPTYTNNAYR